MAFKRDHVKWDPQAPAKSKKKGQKKVICCCSLSFTGGHVLSLIHTFFHCFHCLSLSFTFVTLLSFNMNLWVVFLKRGSLGFCFKRGSFLFVTLVHFLSLSSLSFTFCHCLSLSFTLDTFFHWLLPVHTVFTFFYCFTLSFTSEPTLVRCEVRVLSTRTSPPMELQDSCQSFCKASYSGVGMMSLNNIMQTNLL